MAQDTQQLQGWIGRDLIDGSGQRVGRIADIYLDDDTGEPEWLAVSTGTMGGKVSFVPLTGAAVSGNDLQVQFTQDQITGSPHADADGQLSQDEEARLYAHYGYDYGERRSDSGLPEGGGAPRSSGDDAMTRSSGDDAMTRSEEELAVSKTSREAGRVRLRKWVDTERVETAVPVAREEVRIEREPITDANVDQAMAGAEITESEHEVVLNEEEAVATTRVTPKERIRVDKDTVVEEQQVAADLRKERVELQDDTTRR